MNWRKWEIVKLILQQGTVGLLEPDQIISLSASGINFILINCVNYLSDEILQKAIKNSVVDLNEKLTKDHKTCIAWSM